MRKLLCAVCNYAPREHETHQNHSIYEAYTARTHIHKCNHRISTIISHLSRATIRISQRANHQRTLNGLFVVGCLCVSVFGVCRYSDTQIVYIYGVGGKWVAALHDDLGETCGPSVLWAVLVIDRVQSNWLRVSARFRYILTFMIFADLMGNCSYQAWVILV